MTTRASHRERLAQLEREMARAVRWEAETILARLPLEPAYLIARRRAALLRET